MRTNGAKHPMGVVTRRTGLRADLIRAWERRHQAIEPSRTDGNRRLYSDDDIERLLLIRRALDAGWQIGHVAGLDNEEILGLVDQIPPTPEIPAAHAVGSADAEACVERCLAAVANLDEESLRRELERAAAALGRTRLIDDCLVRILVEIGRGCGQGQLRTAHEHLASAVLRSFLDSMRGSHPTSDATPALIVTTPRFQHHELAAMLVAATARGEGWRTTYLGPNLPAEEIAGAVLQRDARAVALSITFPADDATLPDELQRLRRMVPQGTDILVGGRSSDGYREILDSIGAILLPDLPALRDYLNRVRSGEARP